MKNINDIKHALYINLETRPDRKLLVEQEFMNLGINIDRYNAIKLPNNNINSSALGCSISHLNCMRKAKENNWPHVLICEDDIQFLEPSLFVKQLNTFLSNQECWDVILLAGNNMLPYCSIDNSCIKVMNCLTTTGYIVENHYYDILINNYEEGIKNLMSNPNEIPKYAIDKYWIKLQRIHDWYLITPLSVIQRENYSDIENKITNFKDNMLNYNKVVRKVLEKDENSISFSLID